MIFEKRNLIVNFKYFTSALFQINLKKNIYIKFEPEELNALHVRVEKASRGYVSKKGITAI